MIHLRTGLVIAFSMVLLAACTGSQTGKGLNAFDAKYKDSPWYTDDSGPLHSNSFWYSGYSDDDIENAGKAAGGGGFWGGGVGPNDSGGAGHSDAGASHSDSGSSGSGDSGSGN